MIEQLKLKRHVLCAVGFKLTDLESDTYGMLSKEEEVVLSSNAKHLIV